MQKSKDSVGHPLSFYNLFLFHVGDNIRHQLVPVLGLLRRLREGQDGVGRRIHRPAHGRTLCPQPGRHSLRDAKPQDHAHIYELN